MKIFRRVFISIIILGIIACSDMPMGMGDPIDWEPPVLTMDPVSHPYYAKLGAKLTGTVTDNVAVDRVILRDTETGEILFHANLLGNDRWEMALTFTEEDNTKQIIAEIVAFDKMGNSGEESIKAITIIVDIGPPLVKDIIIKRSDTRTMDLVEYNVLKELEIEDPVRHRSENADKYQNGRFYINAYLEENETRIDELELKIYDLRNPDDPMDDALIITPEMLPGSSKYAPVWLIDEKDILDAGGAQFGASYRTDYLAGARYYYRVLVTAFDRSKNQNTVEEQGYFCLWDTSDNPMGIVDAKAVGETNPITITSGSSIPIIFFDDDKLGKAYAGLLTEEQWAGTNDIYTGVKIPTGTTDQVKLEFLRDRLLAGQPVYNWRFDKYKSTYNTDPTHKDYNITEQIGNNDLEELIYYVQTGNSSEDHGTYILFTVSLDRKTDPNDKTPAYPVRSGMQRYTVNVIDENVPLIVFDTDAGSPEENTFPKLEEGKYFTIKGYTLKENKSGINRVTEFRVAWIPARTVGGADTLINAVQRALEFNGGTDTEGNQCPYPEGVQYWDFSDQFDNLTPGKWRNEDISGAGDWYRQQDFSKKFNILGTAETFDGVPDNEPATFPVYNFFHSPCDGTDGAGENCKFSHPIGTLCRENATKLFVFYAKDNVGHSVTRQLRLLGTKTPPVLSVFDITPRIVTLSEDPPNIVYDSPEYDYTNTAYHGKRQAFNDANYTYLKNGFNDIPSGIRESFRSQPLQNYPRGSIVKYWVTASLEGDLGIANIQMEDITDPKKNPNDPPVLLGKYEPSELSLSYVELFPEVTQRSFLITATDTLGNTARMQRTIAISSRARLVSITTNAQDGIYPAGAELEFKANFDGLIRLPSDTPDTNRPRLNIYFNNSNSVVISDQPNLIRSGNIIQIICEPLNGENTLSLSFKFKVPANARGKIETMYYGHLQGLAGDSTNRPIFLLGNNNNLILDHNKSVDGITDPAFTPTNTIGFDWLNDVGSLQQTKNIELDGTPVSVTGIVNTNPVDHVGKAPASAGNYYFKGGETLYLTIKADKPIKTNGTPALEYTITPKGGTAYTRTAGFTYQRPGTNTDEMVFRLDINRTNITTDGRLTSIRLIDEKTITDLIGNTLTASSVSTGAFAGYLTSTTNGKLPINNIYFDLTPPGRPRTRLTPPSGTAFEITTGTDPLRYNAVHTFTIDNAPSSDETHDGEVISKKYSINGGLTWQDYPGSGVALNGSFNNTLMTRYVDTAGNTSAENTAAAQRDFSRPIIINAIFPRLISVGMPNIGTYRTWTGNLQFKLNFDSAVRVENQEQVTITLTNRNSGANNIHNDSSTATGNSYEIVLEAAAGQNLITRADNTSIIFNWPYTGTGYGVNTKEMINGLYISNMRLTGLRDSYNNASTVNGSVSSSTGPENASNIAFTENSTNISNLSAGLIIDTIPPKHSNATSGPICDATPLTPASGTVSTNHTSITIRFNEPVEKGSGKITIRPRGNYAVPAVFENSGYYLGIDGVTKYFVPGSDRTYIPSLFEIYNNPNLNSTQRGYLVLTGTATGQIAGSSFSNHSTNQRTGRSSGPYIQMTHGLVEGPGYTGDYRSAGANAPNLDPDNDGNYLIPDTATKWVLDFQYGINDDNTTVNNIRAALNAAKWRWQEIDVVTTTISNVNPNEVTITLNEPLLRGLQWDVTYPEGTFTDRAGNPVPECDSYWYWSSGVQPPVIRVNRRSYDARAVGINLQPTTARTHAPPSDTEGWNSNTFAVTDSTGWGIGNFNHVHYRVESESPGAILEVGTYKGATSNLGAAFGAWSGTVADANPGSVSVSTANWNAAASNTAGQWILPNLIRRSRNNADQTYTVITKNGTPESRTSTGVYRGFRSYNRDLKESELKNTTNVTLTERTNGYRGVMTFTQYEASKNYVVATATVNSATKLYGYEGIFRSVVMLNGKGGDNNAYVEGSNIKNGMPSIAGFPVRDAEETGDNRFIKMFLKTANDQRLWVSTEIVCEWYFLSWGNGGTHQSVGEANNYLMAGYGDLTYGYNIRNYD